MLWYLDWKIYLKICFFLYKYKKYLEFGLQKFLFVFILAKFKYVTFFGSQIPLCGSLLFLASVPSLSEEKGGFVFAWRSLHMMRTPQRSQMGGTVVARVDGSCSGERINKKRTRRWVCRNSIKWRTYLANGEVESRVA